MISFIDTFKTLLAEASISGYEGKCAKVIAEIAKPYCDEISIDALGNVIAHKCGKGKKLMMPAHMDVIGFMVTGVDDKGFVSVTSIGGQRSWRLGGTRIKFANGTRGIVCPRAASEIGANNASHAQITDIYVDIGAESEKSARKMVRVGDYATFDYGAEVACGDTLISPYCDNLASAAALLCAMSIVSQSENDLYYVFTVREEVGCLGAKTAAYAIEPDMAIAIDLTATGDCPANEPMEVSLAKGPTIKIKDSSVICSAEVVKHLRDAADANKIAYQDEVLLHGGTDTSATLTTGKGVQSGCVSIPGRYIHSPVETINIKDAENAAKLLAAAATLKI